MPVLRQRLIDNRLLVSNVVLAQRKPLHSVAHHARQHHQVRQGLDGTGADVLPVVVLGEARELLLVVRLKETREGREGREGGREGG